MVVIAASLNYWNFQHEPAILHVQHKMFQYQLNILLDMITEINLRFKYFI